MVLTHIQRIEAASNDLAHYLADIETLARTLQDNAQLRAHLEAIIAETEVGTDGDLYVRVGGGLRLLPNDMITAIRAAKEYLGG